MRDALRKRPLIFVVIQIRSVQKQPGLLADHFRQPGMRVAQGVDADARDQIQVALP